MLTLLSHYSFLLKPLAKVSSLSLSSFFLRSCSKQSLHVLACYLLSLTVSAVGLAKPWNPGIRGQQSPTNFPSHDLLTHTSLHYACIVECESCYVLAKKHNSQLRYDFTVVDMFMRQFSQFKFFVQYYWETMHSKHLPARTDPTVKIGYQNLKKYMYLYFATSYMYFKPTLCCHLLACPLNSGIKMNTIP